MGFYPYKNSNISTLCDSRKEKLKLIVYISPLIYRKLHTDVNRKDNAICRTIKSCEKTIDVFFSIVCIIIS